MMKFNMINFIAKSKTHESLDVSVLNLKPQFVKTSIVWKNVIKKKLECYNIRKTKGGPTV